MVKVTGGLLAIVGLLLLVSCGKGTKTYPDVLPGWHSPGFDVVFGRLARVPSKDPAEPPTWVIRYGLTNTSDPYRGELALMPADKMLGYAGGELVEIRGNVDPAFKSPTYAGTWYVVSAIRIWNGYTKEF